MKKPMFEPLKNQKDLMKDPISGAIVNINIDKINSEREKLQKLKQKQDEFENLKNDVDEIKSLLYQLLEKK